MALTDTDKVFAGSIPAVYQSHLVPLIFEPYAEDLAGRLRSQPIARLLEIAAGTGVVTRQLVAALPGALITATDLNQAMLDEAMKIGTGRPVEWRQADAQRLPFPDASFDAVVCQFGVMFFPDRPKAYAEARRVLKPGGTFVFNVWDRLEANEFAACVHEALEEAFPADPPRFLARTPYAYFDRDAIGKDLKAGGFEREAEIDTVSARSRAGSARSAALAYCQGTPVRGEIEARDAGRLGEVTELATERIARRFGTGPVEGGIQALVVTIRA